MSKNGVWQLTRIILNYCDHSGSSKGVRYFTKYHLKLIFTSELINTGRLYAFARENPQIQFVVQLRRGKHPVVMGEWRNGRKFSVECSNDSPEEIERTMYTLRNQWGTKGRKLGRYVISKRPSIQVRV